tara:strand:- start:66 stop:287 length:222 start_codon:yes stop_codon:yes gene_type:complete
MNSKKRQEQLAALMKDEYIIGGTLDFSDCDDVFKIADAACKLLVDNFEIAMEGTYIREIIEQACFESMTRDTG